MGRNNGSWRKNATAATGANPTTPADGVARRRTEMKRLITASLLILALLGVSRTPEAQIGPALTAVTLVGNAIAIGGCAHAALKAPAPSPAITPMPPAETGG